jgi:hypothetical protein
MIMARTVINGNFSVQVVHHGVARDFYYQLSLFMSYSLYLFFIFLTLFMSFSVYLSLFLYLFLSLFMSFSVYLSLFLYLFLSLFMSYSLYLFFIFLTLFLSLCLPLSLSLSISHYRSHSLSLSKKLLQFKVLRQNACTATAPSWRQHIYYIDVVQVIT